MISRVCTVVAATGLLALAPAASASAAPGGCKAFGESVAGYATSLGQQFGANASSVATLGPRAFPESVVHPEQDAACPD